MSECRQRPRALSKLTGYRILPMQHLDWPFFADSHRTLAPQLRAWAERSLHGHHDESPAAVDATCRQLVGALGDAGFTRYCVPRAYGGTSEDFDARAICLVRETLAEYDGLADFAFAMQGLGSGAMSIAGSDALQ